MSTEAGYTRALMDLRPKIRLESLPTIGACAVIAVNPANTAYSAPGPEFRQSYATVLAPGQAQRTTSTRPEVGTKATPLLALTGQKYRTCWGAKPLYSARADDCAKATRDAGWRSRARITVIPRGRAPTLPGDIRKTGAKPGFVIGCGKVALRNDTVFGLSGPLACSHFSPSNLPWRIEQAMDRLPLEEQIY